MKIPKVFCIGWHKTGTTTLGDALLILGYKVLGARIDLAEQLLEGKVNEVLNLVENYDAFQDVPWNALFKQLDKRFPNSKFILTIRNEDSWLLSATKHFGKSYSPMREWLYGVGILAEFEDAYLKRYKNHYEEVYGYFKNRPNDLLIMDLAAGDGWNKLCPFLGVPIPKKKFPHSNKGKHSYSWKDRFINWLKDITPMFIRSARIKLLRKMGVADPRYRFNNRVQNENARKLIKK